MALHAGGGQAGDARDRSVDAAVGHGVDPLGSADGEVAAKVSEEEREPRRGGIEQDGRLRRGEVGERQVEDARTARG